MFGTYTFDYTPPSQSGSESSIRIQVSQEANIPEILGHFESFLRAAGYPLDLDSHLAVVEWGE